MDGRYDPALRCVTITRSAVPGLRAHVDHDEITWPDLGQADRRVLERPVEIADGLFALGDQDLGVGRDPHRERPPHSRDAEFIEDQPAAGGVDGDHAPGMPLTRRDRARGHAQRKRDE